MPSAFVFDAYGTLFDVHAAIARHRAAAGPDADRFSDIWRAKQLEYTWTLTLAGDYADFWTLTQRALDFLCPCALGRQNAARQAARRLSGA
jgi:2-haloacid dehalogenase